MLIVFLWALFCLRSVADRESNSRKAHSQQHRNTNSAATTNKAQKLLQHSTRNVFCAASVGALAITSPSQCARKTDTTGATQRVDAEIGKCKTESLWPSHACSRLNTVRLSFAHVSCRLISLSGTHLCLHESYQYDDALMKLCGFLVTQKIVFINSIVEN